MNSWIYLIIAIIFEIMGTTSLKLSNGFTDPKYSALMVLFYILSLGVLSLALKDIEIGVAYAIWVEWELLLSLQLVFYFSKKP